LFERSGHGNLPCRARSRRHECRRRLRTSRGLVRTVRSTSRTEELERGAYSLLDRGVGDRNVARVRGCPLPGRARPVSRCEFGLFEFHDERIEGSVEHLRHVARGKLVREQRLRVAQFVGAP